MHRSRAIAIGLLLLASGCSRGPAPRDARSVAPASGPGQAPASGGTQPAQVAQIANGTRPLDQFEALSAADVELYLKVMRAAAERVRTLSSADRAALKTFHDLTTGQTPSQMPSPDQMAAMQRAGDLLSLDSVVAREMGVAPRYSSISGRVPKFGMPEGTGEGDDKPMTAEQRAALKARIERFRQRRQLDLAALEPHRQEIEALQKQVDLISHPESIPR